MEAISEKERVREVYLRTWEKYRQQSPLDGIEEQVLDVILSHPEYHALLSDRDLALAFEADPSGGIENPFLHMGLHLAIREQISLGRPPEVRRTYRRLLLQLGDAHEVEHQMMLCLAEALWEYTQDPRVQGEIERSYLDCLARLGD
ncbi:MAG: DUF1841 family protein [Gammaproteobacteria bacterium]|nr:MAG: DUF1841 family protein [Gammaproteobacteria bacterium]